MASRLKARNFGRKLMSQRPSFVFGVACISIRCVVLEEGAKQTARLITLVIYNKGLLVRAA